MKNINIRFIKENDAPEILSIYRPYIEETTITFECITPSLSDFEKRIKKISAFYPYLVCEIDNKVIGYAYAGKIRERDAYMWDAELSIYLDKQFQNLGIGKILYKTLIEILKLQNVYNVYGVITLPNDGSVKLHKKLGFNTIGIFHNTGYKFDSWRDVIWLEKNIKEFNGSPETLTAIHDVDKTDIDEVLLKYNNKLLKL